MTEIVENVQIETIPGTLGFRKDALKQCSDDDFMCYKENFPVLRYLHLSVTYLLNSRDTLKKWFTENISHHRPEPVDTTIPIDKLGEILMLASLKS